MAAHRSAATARIKAALSTVPAPAAAACTGLHRLDCCSRLAPGFEARHMARQIVRIIVVECETVGERYHNGVAEAAFIGPIKDSVAHYAGQG